MGRRGGPRATKGSGLAPGWLLGWGAAGLAPGPVGGALGLKNGPGHHDADETDGLQQQLPQGLGGWGGGPNESNGYTWQGGPVGTWGGGIRRVNVPKNLS